jgi:hypothetical protein
VPEESALRKVRVPGEAKFPESPLSGNYENHLSEMPTIRPNALRSMLDVCIGDNALVESTPRS